MVNAHQARTKLGYVFYLLCQIMLILNALTDHRYVHKAKRKHRAPGDQNN